MCVGFLSFCDGGALSSSSPPAGGGVVSCCASFGVAAVPLVLRHLRLSAACPAVAALLGFCTWLTQVGWPTPAVDVFCVVGGILVPHLVFYLVPAQLPLPLLLLSGLCFLPLLLLTLRGLCFLPLLLLTLRGCCVLSGSSLRVYSCGGALWLGWWGFCCVTWFSTLCRALPQGPAAFPAAGYLGVLRSPGVCPSASLVT